MKENQNIGMWVAIGAGIGTAIGVALGNIGVGIAIGVGLGVAMAFANILKQNWFVLQTNTLQYHTEPFGLQRMLQTNLVLV